MVSKQASDGILDAMAAEIAAAVAVKEVNYMRPTLTINETLSLKRKAGMRASYWDEVTGIESGRYPYGHTTRAARPDGSPGRRIVRIYRADLEAWIKSKEATNAV